MTELPPFNDTPSTDRKMMIGGVLLIALLLTVIAVTGLPGLELNPSKSYEGYFFINRTLFWICLLLMWIYSVKVEKQPLLIWKERRQGILHYLLAIVCLIVATVVGLMFVNTLLLLVIHKKEHSEIGAGMIQYFRSHSFLFYYTLVTAGFTEELIVRGYLFPRLVILLRNRYWAMVVSALFFGLLHIKYGTFQNVAAPVMIGFLCAWYYDRYRNIKVLILYHILWDWIVLYLSMKHG